MTAASRTIVFDFVWRLPREKLKSQRLNRNAHGFEAGLFHPGLGNEVVRGRIFINAQALSFQSDATKLTIPIEQLVVELGDDDGRIYFRSRKSSALRIFTGDQSVLDAESHLVRNHLERMATRREIARRLRITAYVFAGCLFLGWL